MEQPIHANFKPDDPVYQLALEVDALSAQHWKSYTETRDLSKLILYVQGQDQRLLDMLDTTIKHLQAERDKIAARMAGETGQTESAK
jgi:hypothetical protein